MPSALGASRYIGETVLCTIYIYTYTYYVVGPCKTYVVFPPFFRSALCLYVCRLDSPGNVGSVRSRHIVLTAPDLRIECCWSLCKTSHCYASGSELLSSHHFCASKAYLGVSKPYPNCIWEFVCVSLSVSRVYQTCIHVVLQCI